MSIPIYHKTASDWSRPTDAAFYLMTGDGPFFCRNHPFFRSDVPTLRPPASLAPHTARCEVNFPQLGVTMLELIVGFFSRIFDLHSSESVVLLYWDLQQNRYRLHIPEQQATVWESLSGRRSPMDVSYQVPYDRPSTEILVGDVHCHGDLAAYSSQLDKEDEQHRDGVHFVVGHVDQEPPQFHGEIAIDGSRFTLSFDQLFRGYTHRRHVVPQQWIDQVQVIVKRPQWTTTDNTRASWESSGTTYGGERFRWDGSSNNGSDRGDSGDRFGDGSHA